MPIRIQQVLKEVVKLMRATIPSNIKIDQGIRNDTGPVVADPTQVHQIAMNLMTNAYHAVEENGGEISIGLEQRVLGATELNTTHLKPGSYAVMSVSDTGCGIDAESMAKIFDPYFTTKAPGRGTGLGLSVVYGIVKDHAGHISVDSKSGQGSTFKILLPTFDDPEGAKLPIMDSIHETGTERILLVDDDEVVLTLEKQILERLGYQVDERLNSVEALNAIKSKPDAVDLVVTDMTLPNLTGDRLSREIFAINPHMPIVICTGFSERIDKEKAFS